MEKIYQPIGWEDFPSEKTPINSENLGKMDLAINEIDIRVVEHDGRVKELERVIESGGGDSQIDPRRIPDMYYKESASSEIFPETTLASIDESGMMIIPTITSELIEGETYTVSWNGTEYNCVCQAIPVDDVIIMCLGDMYTMSGGNVGTSATGEPFAVMVFPPEFRESMGAAGQIVPLDGSTTTTVSIQCNNTTIHKIPNKYLDLDWTPAPQKSMMLSLTNITIVSGNEIENKSCYELNLTNPQYVQFDEIIVKFDGALYECIISKLSDTSSYITPKGYNGIDDMPFVIVSGETFSQFASTLGEHEIEIIGVVIPKMPVKFMPKVLDRVVLRTPLQSDGTYHYYELALTSTGALITNNVTSEFTE